MAYDLTRCPQTDDEFRDYFYALTGMTLGANASDWEAVLSRSYPWQGQSLRIPEGVGPGISQRPDAPFFGLTQQWSGGPKGRVFLPAAVPDELGYLTRCMQYLDDAAQTYSAKKNPKETFSTKSGGLVWAWYWVAGNAYSPVQPADGSAPPPSGGTGLTEAQVQAMIDTQCVKYGDRIALRTSGDSSAGIPKSLLCAEEGGPRVNGDPVQLTGRTGAPGPWETLTVEEGQG